MYVCQNAFALYTFRAQNVLLIEKFCSYKIRQIFVLISSLATLVCVRQFSIRILAWTNLQLPPLKKSLTKNGKTEINSKTQEYRYFRTQDFCQSDLSRILYFRRNRVVAFTAKNCDYLEQWGVLLLMFDNSITYFAQKRQNFCLFHLDKSQLVFWK